MKQADPDGERQPTAERRAHEQQQADDRRRQNARDGERVGKVGFHHHPVVRWRSCSILTLGVEPVIDLLGERPADAGNHLEIGQSARSTLARSRSGAAAPSCGPARCRGSRRSSTSRAWRSGGRGGCQWRSDAPRHANAAGSTAPDRGRSAEAAAGREERCAHGRHCGQALGDRRDRDGVDAKILQDLSRHGELAGAAVDQHQVRPLPLRSIGVFGYGAAEAAGQYLRIIA